MANKSRVMLYVISISSAMACFLFFAGIFFCLIALAFAAYANYLFGMLAAIVLAFLSIIGVWVNLKILIKTQSAFELLSIKNQKGGKFNEL